MNENSGELVDRELVCQDCGEPFVFEVGEQLFFRDKGFEAPKRCNPCRREARARAHGKPDAMPGGARICRECGTSFALDARDEHWFSTRGLARPTRCLACRRARRELAREAGQQPALAARV